MRFILPAVALLLALGGCRTVADQPRPEPGPFPHYARPDLVDLTTAYLTQGVNLPAGPGADGRRGDYVLENSLARFIIGGPGRSPLQGMAGQVLDAVPQNGQDRIRLMGLVVGAEHWPVVYTRVELADAGGQNRPAVVQASGHVSAYPAVSVETRYILRPDTDSLQVFSTVRNAGRRRLSGFGLHEVVYPGRTFRFSPRGGRFPRGRNPGSAYFLLYRSGSAWGVVPGAGRAFEEEQHEPGRSILTYGSSDLLAGESRTCTRRLVATGQGPGRVWAVADKRRVEGETARVQFKPAGAQHSAVPRSFEALVRPRTGEPPALVVSGADGVAQLSVPGGRYAMRAMSPGYAGWGPVSVRCSPGNVYQFPVRFGSPHMLYLDVLASSDNIESRAPARVVDYLVGDDGVQDPVGPGFPVQPARRVQLVGGYRSHPVALRPGRASRGAAHLVTVSRGPLYEVASARIEAQPGRDERRTARLARRIDGGAYRAVDFRQYDARCLDSPLTRRERIMANACEGLDAAVVAVPPGVPSPASGKLAADDIVPGVRVELPGAGSYTVWPARPGDADWSRTAERLAAGQALGNPVRLLRQAYPEARIAVHRPFHPARGALALAGWTDPAAEPPADFAPDFDALEILSGGDVARAGQLREAWFSLLNRGHRIMVVGASGSRTISGDEAGIARTFVRLPDGGGAVNEGIRAMAAGPWQGVPDAFVSNGPIVTATLNDRPIGSVQSSGVGHAKLFLRIQAAPWVRVDRATIYRNGRILNRIEVKRDDRIVRFEKTLDVGVFGDSWFCVVVEGDRPMVALYGSDAPKPLAVTNPFWVDVDGDGEIEVSQF